MSHYVLKGLINIEELVSDDKISLIEPVLKDFNGGSITHIKEKLGKDTSFGEIRLVIAWTIFKNNTTK